MSALNGQKTSQKEKEATRGRFRQWLDFHGKLPEEPAAKEDEQHAANRTEAISSGGDGAASIPAGATALSSIHRHPMCPHPPGKPAGDTPGFAQDIPIAPFFFRPLGGDPGCSLPPAVFFIKKGAATLRYGRHAHQPLRSLLTGAAFGRPPPNGPGPPALPGKFAKKSKYSDP